MGPATQLAAASVPHVIRYGHNAGQARPTNDLVLDRLSAAKRAVITLKREGFTVIGVEVDYGIRPTITIQPCAKCAGLIASGKATHYKWINGASGREVWGQWQIDNCRVLWTEKGH